MGMDQSIYIGAVAVCYPKTKTETRRSGFQCSQCNKEYKQAYEGKYCAKCGGGLLQMYKNVDVKSPDAYDATEAVEDELYAVCGEAGWNYDVLRANSSNSKWGITIEDSDDISLQDLPDKELVLGNFVRGFEKELRILREMYERVEIKMKIVIDWG